MIHSKASCQVLGVLEILGLLYVFVKQFVQLIRVVFILFSSWTSCHELLVEFTPSWLQLVRCSNTCIGPCVWSLEHIVELLHSATLNATFVQFPKPNTTNFNNFGFVSDFFHWIFLLVPNPMNSFLFLRPPLASVSSRSQVPCAPAT